MNDRPNIKRIVPKPWGQELIWAETKDYVGKLLSINHDNQLSRQYHEIKEETIYITGIMGAAEINLSSVNLPFSIFKK